MTLTINLTRGEAKTIPFTIKQNGTAIDLTTYSDRTYSFIVKEEKGDDTAIITKTNEDFITTDEDIGIIKININSDESDIVKRVYVAQLTVQLDNLDPSQNLDKSKVINFIIHEAV